jgi:hypothetical protein
MADANTENDKENDLEAVQAFIYNDEVQSTLEEINNHLLPINVLEISGMGNQEIKHSNVLAWMFGDNQHQLDDQILSKFLGKVAELKGINADTDEETLKNLRHYAYFPENKRDITIKREWKHIDLLIEDKANKVVIAIENKVWAGQSEHQLKDYENVIDNEYPKKQDKQDKENKVSWKRYYIFLTPDGRDAKMEQEQNTAQKMWLKANYQIIYNILKGMGKSNQDIPEEAKMILKSYNDLLIKEDIVESQELQELCAKIWKNHRKALGILIQKEPNNTQILNKLVLEKLEKLEKDLGLKQLRKQNKGHIFVFSLENTKELVSYYLEFNRSDGIYLKISINQDANDEKIPQMRKALGFQENSNSKRQIYREANWDEIINDISDEKSLQEKIKVDIDKCIKQIEKWEKQIQDWESKLGGNK